MNTGRETLDFPTRVERITPFGGDYFFGYYDLEAWNADATRHLAARVPFMDRLQEPGDEVVVGFFDSTRASPVAQAPFVAVDTTRAWCFQQSCMLQWHPRRPRDTIVFNTVSATWFTATVLDLATGQRTTLDQPVATVAPDGRHALSINFARMYSFRPGYGYASHADPWDQVPRPTDDGIYRVDLDTGQADLLISLDAAWRFAAERHTPPPGEEKVLVNHITWNTDSTRFLFLLRYRRAEGGWVTTVIVANADGEMTRVLVPFGYASHYWWTGPSRVLFHSDGPQGRGQYEFDVETGEARLVDAGVFTEDTHMRQIPGTSWVVNDTYSRSSPYRSLFLYDRSDERVVRLGRFYSPPEITGDIRCDLHPRVSPDGRRVSVDSVHEGFRGIYTIDVGDVVAGL